MWARLILDLVRTLQPALAPEGRRLVVAEVVYTVTDPPIKLFRRLVPPLRIGAIALDFGWSLDHARSCIVLMIVALAVRGVSDPADDSGDVQARDVGTRTVG